MPLLLPAIGAALLLGGLTHMSSRGLQEENDGEENDPRRKEAPARRRQVRNTPPITARTRKSPIADVPVESWDQFRLAMADPANSTKISGSGHLGLYRFSWPRLDELGMAYGVKRTGRQWSGKFAPPYSVEGFLVSPTLQDSVFGLSCAEFASRIRDQHRADIGRDIDGTPTTLSGLVAVAHCAGLHGQGSWLSRSDDRVRYPHTTAAFRRANGLF